MKLESGHEVINVPKDENDLQKEKFLAYSNGVIQLKPGNWYFPRYFEEFGNEIYNFKFRATDVVVMGNPKCGTTWSQEIVWTMRNNPNLDNPMAKMDVVIRVPFMEADFIMNNTSVSALPFPKELIKQITGSDDVTRFFINSARNVPDPRTIKSHLSFTLLENNLLDACKVVYVIRNPKDVCVSFLHHHRLLTCHSYIGTNDEFVDFFINGKIMYGPYWETVKEAWEQRDHPNLCILFYEKMKSDPMGEISRLNKFLGTNLTPSQIENVASYTDFSNMKKISVETVHNIDTDKLLNKNVLDADGGFFRKGVTGDWKNKLTETQAQKIDNWTKAHVRELGTEFQEMSNY